MTEPTSAQELFKGRRFDREIFVLCVRLYLNFKLSSRDLVQMMAERGIKATGSTSIAPWTKAGRTVDFLLSRRRDIAAAKRFFSRATGQHGVPRVITLDGYAALHRAVAKLKEVGMLPRHVRVRSCKYLNSVVEQDHRRIKQPIRPMLGFKRFETAAVTIRGIELAMKIKKQQFNLKPLTGKATTAPEIWAAVLTA